jgi:hypothetical protein
MSVTSPDDILGIIMNIVYIGFFAVFYFFSTKIRTLQSTFALSRSLKKLRAMRDKTKNEIISAMSTEKTNKESINKRVNNLMDQFIIKPSDIDPAGVTKRYEHVLDASDKSVKTEIKSIAPTASEQQIQNLQNLIETGQALNKMYRVVRNYYILGKKQGSQYQMVQIEMQLPSIMEEAEAYAAFTDAFRGGKPIGDGIGPLAASQLMVEQEKFEVAQEVVAAKTAIDNRQVIVAKAKGPGGTVGKIGDAVQYLIEANGGKISLIIMVDAALKLEGEVSGSIAEGVGAAIGGPGIDQYKIEEIATKYKVPVYAIVVKESIKEVLAPMTPAITKAADNVVDVFRRVIQERTQKNDVVLIIGVGNTMGIAQ